MRKFLLLLGGMLLLSWQLMAQNRSISGKVVDEQGKAIPNATVVIKGTATGTSTKDDGHFTILVTPSQKELVISSVGYTPQTVVIGKSNTINVTLASISTEISTVVVTGYTQAKKSQFSGAASVVSAKQIETVPVASFDQILQGRAPGLLVNSGSGQPGSSARVAIRGVQSISGAFVQPLYIVDGVPMEANAFQAINSNDFESVTVLKDASASAIYGSRAGNGVIVVTTKKGKAGATNFTYRNQFGVTQTPKWNNFDMMNTDEILSYEERLKLTAPGWTYSRNNPAYAALPATSPVNDPYAASKARYDFLLDSFRNIHTDPLDVLFRQGFSQQHEMNVSGGADRTRYFISGSYLGQNGIELRSDLKRYTTRINFSHTSNKFTIQLNSTTGFATSKYAEGDFIGNSARNSFQIAWRGRPYENPYRQDGTLNFGTSTGLAPKLFANTLEGIQNTELTLNQFKANAGLTLAYQLLPYLSLKNVVGIDHRNDRWGRWINPASQVGSGALFARGLNSEVNEVYTQIINTSSINFMKSFGEKHDVEANAYFEVLRTYNKGLGFTVYYLDPRLPQTGQGAGNGTQYPPVATSAKSGYGIRSYFGTLRYTYDGKYTLNAILRRDGTSRIVNPSNKEITTWSLGATWNLAQENFFANQKLFNDVKLRASYGITPNISSIPTGSYSMLSLTSITNYLSPQVPAYGGSNYAGALLISGLAPTSPGNPNLRIENIRKFNVGTDLSFWKNRARLTVEYYINRTVDLFVSQPLPRESGFTSATINAGIMSNKGIEASLSVDVYKSKLIDVTVGANHAFNKNRIVDLGLVDQYESGTFLIKKGLAYGSHYTYNYLGADPATGQPVYETLDGGKTTDLGKAGRFAKFGTFMPKHIGGFNTDIRIGDFTVSALFSYQFGVVRSNNIENWVVRGTPGYAGSVNQSRRLLTQQWLKPGDVAKYQGFAYDRDFTSSDLQDASFLRFRNITISYQMPQVKVAGTRIIKSGRIYAQGQNLFVWSPWRGPDPEDNNNISLNEYPNPRILVVGLDINF